MPPHLTYADLAHLTHEPEPFGGSVFVSRANHAAASHCGSHPGSEPMVSCACGGGALAAVARIEASLRMDGQKCAINGLAAYPDFATAEAKTVVQAKPVVHLVQ